MYRAKVTAVDDRGLYVLMADYGTQGPMLWLGPKPSLDDAVLVADVGLGGSPDWVVLGKVPSDAATKGYVDARLPTGSLTAYAGSTAPTGWLLCSGQEVSQTTYAGLYALLGSTYNTGGETSGYFRVPDLRGRTVAGLDNMGGTDAGRLDWQNVLGTVGTSSITTDSGEQKHTLSTTEMPSHQHEQAAATAYDLSNTVTWGATITEGGGTYKVNQKSPQSSTVATGGGGAHNNMQPTMLLNWIIKA